MKAKVKLPESQLNAIAFNFDIFPRVLDRLNSLDFCIILWFRRRLSADTRIPFISFDEVNKLTFGCVKKLTGAQIDFILNEFYHQFLEISYRDSSFTGKIFEYSSMSRCFIQNVNYFYNLFSYSPSLCYLNSTYPHEIIDFCAYVAAKLNNNPCVIMAENFYSNPPSFQIISALYEYSILDRKSKSARKTKWKKKSLTELTSSLGFSGNSLKRYANEFNNERYSHLFRGNLIQIINYFFKAKRFYKALDLLNEFEVNDFACNKYVLVALHQQPEGVLTSLAEPGFNDQYRFILEVRNWVPKDIVIYVKENPALAVFYRDPEFYQVVNEIPNVRFVSRQVDSIDLIRNALLVASVCGTIGLEAMASGVPALHGGYPFYRSFRGCVSISELEGIQFNDVVSKGVDLSELEDDWNSLLQQSYRGANTRHQIACMNESEKGVNESCVLEAVVAYSRGLERTCAIDFEEIKTRVKHKEILDSHYYGDFKFILVFTFRTVLGQINRMGLKIGRLLGLNH